MRFSISEFNSSTRETWPLPIPNRFAKTFP